MNHVWMLSQFDGGGGGHILHSLKMPSVDLIVEVTAMSRYKAQELRRTGATRDEDSFTLEKIPVVPG